MLSPKTWTVIHRVYDTMHGGLWALLCAGVLFFLVVVAPQISRLQASAEAQRLLEIAAENRSYCEKWGIPTGTHQHLQCTLDLQVIRANVAQRIAEQEFP